MISPKSEAARFTFLLLGAVVFVLDQLTKWLLMAWLASGETRTVIPGLFNLTHLRNRGAAFGLLSESDSPWTAGLLVALSLMVLLLVLQWLWRRPLASSYGLGLGLILGGAGGNLCDRLRAGSVVDFLDLHLGPYHWPAFNLADSAIVLGAGWLIYLSWGEKGLRPGGR
jgi:signal peptidase II